MAYTPPATGGLRITAAGINIGIWMDTTLEGALGDNFIAARLDPAAGWTSFWNSGAQQPADWQAAVTAAGGIVNLIETYLPAINAALAALVTPTPAPGPDNAILRRCVERGPRGQLYVDGCGWCAGPRGRLIRPFPILLAAVVLWGCGGVSVPVVAPAPVYAPTTPPWRLTPGSWTEYQVSRGTGTYNPSTGVITLGAMVPGEIDRITCLPYTLLEGPGIARVYSAQGVAVTTAPAGLVGTLVERNNGTIMGEAANAGTIDQNPPEPLITDNPVAGETFDTTSVITDAMTLGQSNFVTRYWTIATNATVDGFTGATVTALEENPGTVNAFAYEQVFDGGNDLAEIWYGPVAPDGSVQVTILRRVGSGP